MAPFVRRHQQLPTNEGRGYRRSIEAFANFIFPGRRGDVVIPTFPFSLAITCNVPDALVCGTLLPSGHEPTRLLEFLLKVGSGFVAITHYATPVFIRRRSGKNVHWNRTDKS
jgi:hypothetical protein